DLWRLVVVGFPDDVAIEHDKKGRLVLLHEHATIGEIGHRLFRISGVLEKDSSQLAVVGPVPDMDGEVALRARELAWLQDLRDEVRMDLDDIGAEQLQAPRHANVVDEGNSYRHQQRQDE